MASSEWEVTLRSLVLGKLLRCPHFPPTEETTERPRQRLRSQHSQRSSDAATHRWRELSSTLVLASLLSSCLSPQGEQELCVHWTLRAAGQTFKEGVSCLRRLMALRASAMSERWDLGRFKRITYDVLCQNTSARADRRRELHGGACLLHAGTPAQASRRAPVAGLAFADCIGPDPGHFQRRPLYPNQKCLVVLARCGGLSCGDIPGGEVAVLAHLRRLFQRTRRYHDIQGVELALLDHFQLDLSQIECEAKELARVLLGEIGKVDQLLVALLRRKNCRWWQLTPEQLKTMEEVLKRQKRAELFAEFDAWAHPEKFSEEEVLSHIHRCTVKGTSFAQILSSLEHWQLAARLDPSSALRCAVAWLRTRHAFAQAVVLFKHLELWRSEVHLDAFELEALLALQRLVRTDRRQLAAALAALHAAAGTPLGQPPRAWAWAAKAMSSGSKGPIHWPAWARTMEKGAGKVLGLGVPWRLIRSAREMEESLEVLSASSILGMDAEWAPDSSSGLAILQLATWEEVHIWDLQEGPPEAFGPLLQKLLGSNRARKLGFGFAISDWPRLSSLLGSDPSLLRLVDLERLEPTSSGLKGLVAKALGHKLDKTEQSSDWTARPLSEKQLQYAALDAHCLLQIMKALAPKEEDLKSLEVDLDQKRLQCVEETDAQLPGVELRVGQVEEVCGVPGSRSLSSCRVSLGHRSKQVVQGGHVLCLHQRVLVICNLRPRQLHGVTSEAGLLVAAASPGRAARRTARRAAARPPEAAQLGEAVDGERKYPLLDISSPENPWTRAARRLSTGHGLVLLDGRPLLCAGQPCQIDQEGGRFE
ncbi:Exonuclease mut-7 homolog (Exonuclease 3'-5' domain-containing protein 3 homolog) [Durusdinium trenchii]|uniref:Exonuclease mut-7 homolog (Exonuclease 3'-5' domain-containing protein 3 homolog) n=1 Tax=Durusdinium trenchii TaxID=1381693 RepID=A0ABP0HC02_9DINO